MGRSEYTRKVWVACDIACRNPSREKRKSPFAGALLESEMAETFEEFRVSTESRGSRDSRDLVAGGRRAGRRRAGRAVVLALGLGLGLLGRLAFIRTTLVGLGLARRFAISTTTGDGGGSVDGVGSELIKDADFHICFVLLVFVVPRDAAHARKCESAARLSIIFTKMSTAHKMPKLRSCQIRAKQLSSAPRSSTEPRMRQRLRRGRAGGWIHGE